MHMRHTAAHAVAALALVPAGVRARTKSEQHADSQATSSCDATYREHECSTWPPQQLAAQLQPRLVARIRQAVSDVMASFPSGVQPGQLASLMRRPCMQRLCLHVQLFGGVLHVVAPEGMETCSRGGSLKGRLSCPPHKKAWPEDMFGECRHRSKSTRYTRSQYCNATARMAQPGVTIPDFWNDFIYPHTLEWHFAASLNLTSCRATGDVPLPGDHNHVYTRLRLQSALRLLMRAYQRLYAQGELPDPLELLICPNETPVNFGDWCATGAQPIFSSTSNEHATLIPFAQWIQGPDRDTDLAWWNPLEVSSGSASARRELWGQMEPKAVFRGSLHRLSVYTDRWRTLGPRRTQVTRNNWQSVGRTALLATKSRRPDLFNMRLLSKSVEATEGLPLRLAIENATWMAMDKPEYLKRDEQLRFRYAINIEGHGGWADRGYKMLLQPQLALVQDMPALPWYFSLLRPFEHYIPVDSNLQNVTNAVLWARDHDEQMQRVVAAANAATRELVSPSAIFRYSEETLLAYARLLKYRPVLHQRAVPFVCEELASDRTCQLHRASAKPDEVKVGETRCYFRAPRHRISNPNQHFHTLYEASIGLPSTYAKGSLAVDATGLHSASVVRAMRRPDGFRSEV